MLLLGLLAVGLGSAAFGLLTALAATPAGFALAGLAARLVCGLGGAAVNTAAISLIVQAAKASGGNVGSGVGYAEAAETLGEAMGPLLGSVLYQIGERRLACPVCGPGQPPLRSPPWQAGLACRSWCLAA